MITFIRAVSTTFLLIALPFQASALSPAEPVHATGVIYRVIDGDTFDVNLHDAGDYLKFVNAAVGNDRRNRYLKNQYKSIRVRLGSIDTAESVHANEKRNSAEGKATSLQVKRLIEKKEVVVSCYDWGVYGRSICNVEFDLQGQRTDLGEWLILNGHSKYVTRWGRNPFMDARYIAAGQRTQ